MRLVKIGQNLNRVNNLRVKFSALNVDFSSPSPNPLHSRRVAQAGIKEGYPSKKWLFIRCWLV